MRERERERERERDPKPTLLSRRSTPSLDLDQVGLKEARVIGNNLMPCLKSRQLITAGVDTWRLQNKPIKELFEANRWMEDMFVAVGTGVVKTAHWGLTFRVMTGAITSIIDLFTDIYVTYMFWNDGKTGHFNASLASLMVSMTLQLLMVWTQNRKLGFNAVLRAWFPVLIGFKPAVDAYRVATLEAKHEEHLVTPMVEMIAAKAIEMFAEAIPGVIIQLMAIATSGGTQNVSTGAWVSLSISLISTGFISATISYDFDTDPRKRLEVPDFYGYVPTTARKRTIVFMSMTLFTAGMLLIRCMSLVLLGLIGTGWVAAYISADLGLYLIIKTMRRDFWYWMPAGGNAEILISAMNRFVVKIIVDCTSIVHFRHPYEIGGERGREPNVERGGEPKERTGEPNQHRARGRASPPL